MPKKHVFKLINKEGYYEIAGGLIKLSRSSYALSSANGNHKLTISIPSAGQNKFSQKKVTLTQEQVDHLKLEKQDGKIVLLDNENPIKDTEQLNVVIDTDDIIGANRNNIIERLNNGEKVSVTYKNIDLIRDFGLSISYLDISETPFKTVCAFLDFLPPNKEYYFVLEKNSSGERGGYVGYITEDSLGNKKIMHVDTATETTSGCDGTYNYIYDLNQLEGASPLLLKDKIADNILPILEKYDQDDRKPKTVVKAITNLEKLITAGDVDNGLVDIFTESKCTLKFLEDDAVVDNLLQGNLVPIIKPALQMVKECVSGASGKGEAYQVNSCGNSSLKIVKGESYGEIRAAKIVDNKQTDVATFPDVGYFFQNDGLHIRNHITSMNIKIPREFTFLRVVEGSKGECKFALCNSLGNLFFEHKKYDSEYAKLPKFVDVDANTANKYHHCHTWRPLFQLKKELIGEGVGIYKIATDKKIGQLTDEFAYYQGDQLHYINYHEPKEDDCCYNENLEVKFSGGDSSLYIKHSTGGGDMEIHPIFVNQSSDDYLAYHYMA